MSRKTNYFKWTDAESKFVADNAHRMKDEEIAEKLSAITGKAFTRSCVRSARNRLGIKKEHGRGKCGIVSRRINLADIVGAAAASLHIKGGLSPDVSQEGE